MPTARVLSARTRRCPEAGHLRSVVRPGVGETIAFPGVLALLTFAQLTSNPSKGNVMHTIRHSRLAKALLVPMLLAAALLSAGTAHLATAHSGGAVAACPLSTNWDAVTGTCD
jgi:hypothetical protein